MLIVVGPSRLLPVMVVRVTQGYTAWHHSAMFDFKASSLICLLGSDLGFRPSNLVYLSFLVPLTVYRLAMQSCFPLSKHLIAHQER